MTTRPQFLNREIVKPAFFEYFELSEHKIASWLWNTQNARVAQCRPSVTD